MNFRLELNIKPFPKKIQLGEKVFLIGSCFTDHISKKLSTYKFDVLDNPNGILFNPVSIGKAIDTYIEKKEYKESDLFFYNDLWSSWDHHGQFSHPDIDTTLREINNAVNNAHYFLKTANWVIITLGSAWIYKIKNEYLNSKAGQVAANCHKVPQQHFEHTLMAYDEVNKSIKNIIQKINQFNPSANIVLTISPVRHHREGLVENNRSKALLISAVNEAIKEKDNIFYFPSYELIIDDLRDYRFYAEDMVHPNYQATQYVWGKFTHAFMDEQTLIDMEEIKKIVNAKNHKPLHPNSQPHLQFLKDFLQKALLMQQKFPQLNFNNEIEYFKEHSS